MPLAITLTAGLMPIGNSPFPPNYTGTGSGFAAAGSNPVGDTAGSISVGSYYGATILAIANDAAGAAATQLIVTLLSTWDRSFLGDVTTPDGKVYEPESATSIQSTISGSPVTQWIWPLAAGASALVSGTVTFADTDDVLLTLQGDAPSSTEIDLTWTNIGPSHPSNYDLYRGVNSSLSSPSLYQTLAGSTLSYNDTGLTANTQYSYYVVAVYADGTNAASVQSIFTTPASGVSATFNCNCESVPLPEDGFTIDSLANLRKRVAIRCGYAAQAGNLPPGKKDEINEYLRDAQNQLYRQHKEFRTTRLYSWQMEPNQRYYGLQADESGCRRVDPYSIEWVGFEDLNQAWYPLIAGIDPVLYTRAQISTGWPTHYEIRSCIEIFPAPRAAYTLWIKGRFGLDPFVADTDNTTIDSEAIYLLACGLMKSVSGQLDAQSLLTQAGHYTQHLVAGSHHTRRYVPRTRVQTPMTPPRFLPLEE